MFSLTIAFGPSNTLWQLVFREAEKANDAYSKLNQAAPSNQPVIVVDDFGQSTSIMRNQIHGFMLEDMNLSKQAHIERALHQMRTQAEGQTIVENDSVLRAAAARRGGPSIISPMNPAMNGGGFPRG
jgi:hypothetical protein